MSASGRLTTSALEACFDNIFLALLVGCILLQMLGRRNRPAEKEKGSKESVAASRGLYMRYLPVWLCFKAADWLQGPYFHELYSSKVIDGKLLHQEAVAQLFLVGFVSSALFSTLLAPMVDRQGRKIGCIGFVVLYVLAAASTFSSTWSVLVIGRVCSGAATSLLFSAPEAWMVSEHQQRLKLPSRQLDEVFGFAYFLDSLVAIFSGQLAAAAAKIAGPTTPFALSAGFALLGGLLIMPWVENRGQASGGGSSFRQLSFSADVLTVGALQATFEGAMYVFVLVWGPLAQAAVSAASGGLATTPFGKIFSCFMCACMCGSSSIAFLPAAVGLPIETCMLPFFLLAAVALYIAALPAASWLVLTVCFLVFELTVGFYFPAVGALRSTHVPNAQRGLVLNLVRLPLNLIVITVSLYRETIGNAGALKCASCALLFASALLLRLRASQASKKKSSE